MSCLGHNMEAQAKEKRRKTTTIEISIENYDKIHSVCKNIAKILRKRHVSPDQALSIMFATQPLEVVLQDMMLEDGVEH